MTSTSWKGSTVQLDGLHKVLRRVKGGYVLHVYGWRGRGAPSLGSYKGENAGACHKAANADSAGIAQRYADYARPCSASLMSGLIAEYRRSPEWARLAASTKVQWGSWLNRIDDLWGPAKVSRFDKHGARRDLLIWRNWIAKESGPRAADYGMQVMRRLLAFAVDREELRRNPAQGIEGVYRAERSELIWEAEHLEAVNAIAPDHVRWALNLAAITGLRCSDLARLPWSAVEAEETRTSKTGALAVIPSTSALRAVLAGIPRLSPVILTASHGRPWKSGNTMSKAIQHWAKKAGVDRHTHDLRGTAATRYMLAGLTDEQIATVMAWDVKHVARLRTIYVSRGAVARQIAEKLG